MEGWIKLHRSLLEWRYWGDHEALTLWIYLLQMANHKEGWSFRGIKLNPGQLLTGRDKIAEACHLHRSKVERILKKLEIEQQIEQQKTNKWRIITIVKWKEYQLEGQQFEHQIEQQMSNKRATNEHIQELKNYKKEKNMHNQLVYDAIDYLNGRLGKKFSCSRSKTIELITARAKEGATLDDFKKVIDIKISNWLNTDMASFLRPETLFGPKFDSYLNQVTAISIEEEHKKNNEYFLQDGQITGEATTSFLEELWTKD